MIFICDIIIYPLIKKNKFNCVFLSLNIVIVSKNLKSLQTMCLYRTKKKSTNILGVSVLGAGPVGTQSASRPVETRRNPFRLTRLNPSKHVQTCYVSSRPNELFSIFLFLYFLPPLPPPNFPPSSPYSFFVFFWGWGGGGEGRGTGRGRRRHRGGATTTTAGRSVAPPKGGGQSPPPLLHQTKNKQTKFTNQTTYLL